MLKKNDVNEKIEDVQTLQEIDKKILTIDDFLEGIEFID